MSLLMTIALRHSNVVGRRLFSAVKAPALTGNPALVDFSIFDRPPSDPITLLNSWFDSAIKLGVSEPMDFVLATADKNSFFPSTRVLLAKCVNQRGLVFGSTKNSLKGIQLSENNRAAANFWWRETMQQVCIVGIVEELSNEESNELFAERTKSAQAIAALSKQSSPMADEKTFRSQVNSLVSSNSDVVRPPHWQGYTLKIQRIEFWLGSTDRFHKRLLYENWEGTGWTYSRLQP